MTIDLYALPSEEFALAWAIEGITFQYAYSPGRPSEEQSPLAAKAYEVLIYYGFVALSNDAYVSDDVSSAIAVRLEERDRLLKNYKYQGRIRFDVGCVNKRAQHNLIVLAALSERYLSQGDNYLYHNSVSAGEYAFGELQTYGLLYTDNRGCGYWTEEGLKVLATFGALGEFPK